MTTELIDRLPDIEPKKSTNGAPSYTSLTELSSDERAFMLAQREAKALATSSLLPKDFQGNVANVMIALNMAKRLNVDPLQVMQNLYIVHGKPGWSSQFLIACFNKSGRFDAIKFRMTGEEGQMTRGCVAYTHERSTGELIESIQVTMAMAKAEGWIDKNGSKWKTMPEQMLRYRAASFLVKTTAPEIAMGFATAEEVYDSIDSPSVREPGGRKAEPIDIGHLEEIAE